MLGISALSFDIEEKLRFVQSCPSIGYMEYGIDEKEEFEVLRRALASFENRPPLAFHLPLKANPAEDIPVLRRANLEYLREIIVEGLKFEPLYFNMHLGHLFQSRYEKNPERYHRLAADYLKELLEIDPGVRLYVENMYSLSQERSGDLISFGKSREEIRAVLNLIDSPRLGFCRDIGHEILSGESYGEEAFVKEALLHFNTNRGERDEHLGFLGKDYDYGFLQRLRSSGKFRFVLLELPASELAAVLEEMKRRESC